MGYRESYQSIIEFINKSLDAEAPKVVAAFDLMKRCEEYTAVLKEYRNTKFQIEAFDYFLKGLTREQVLEAIQHRRWLHKHEILTRWAWMCSQEKEVRKGEKVFNHLYQCKVGSRFGRDTIDREYEIFRIFLPFYTRKSDIDYLFFEKLENPNDPPDFKVKNTYGDVLGIEVTEAVDESYPNKQDKFIECLKIDFPKCEFFLYTRPTWDDLYDNYCVVRDWISELLDESPSIDHVKNSGWPIELSIKMNGHEFNFHDASGLGNGKGYADDFIKKEICELCKESIKKKLFTKKGTPKRKPEKPFVLAIYENSGIPFANFKHIENKDINNENLNWNDYFGEIWLVNYKDCMKLLG